MPFLSAPAIVLYLLGLLGPLVAAVAVTGARRGTPGGSRIAGARLALALPPLLVRGRPILYRCDSFHDTGTGIALRQYRAVLRGGEARELSVVQAALALNKPIETDAKSGRGLPA